MPLSGASHDNPTKIDGRLVKNSIELNLYYHWMKALKSDKGTLSIDIAKSQTETDSFELQIIHVKLSKMHSDFHFEDDTIYYFSKPD